MFLVSRAIIDSYHKTSNAISDVDIDRSWNVPIYINEKHTPSCSFAIAG